MSEKVVSSTGATQGTVLSSYLFTLYTSDFLYNSESCHLQKYSDDSAAVWCISDGQEAQYRELVDHFLRKLKTLNAGRRHNQPSALHHCTRGGLQQSTLQKVGDLSILTPLCHFTWPTTSWLSCCRSQSLPLCYNTTDS